MNTLTTALLTAAGATAYGYGILCLIAGGKASEDAPDERPEGDWPHIPFTVPAAPSVGSGLAITAGEPAPLNPTFEEWGIPFQPGLGRHWSADDFNLLHDNGDRT